MSKTNRAVVSRSFFSVQSLAILAIAISLGSAYIVYQTFTQATAQRASTSDSPSAVQTCIDKTNGNVRIVESIDSCRKNERQLALQGAISNLISDVEVLWYTPPGDGSTNYDSGVRLSCPDGKTAIGGGGTEVLSRNVPYGDSILGAEGETSEATTGWEIVPDSYIKAPVVYTICAKINQ